MQHIATTEIVVQTLKKVLSSTRDGAHLKWQKIACQTVSYEG